MSNRKICVVTGSRADYGLLYPVIKRIKQHNNLDLQVVATTMHLSSDFGSSYKQIESDGFEINEKIDNLFPLDLYTSMAKSTGMAIIKLADSFERIKPDIILLLGDRFETHAAATTAILMNIPVAHIHGGEATEGAVDEQLRHSITKMSYLHFCSTNEYRQKIIQMGEDPQRVFNFGAPGIDNILSFELLTKVQLGKYLNWRLPDEFALFTYHPETLDNKNITSNLDSIFRALKGSNLNIIFTYANADFGGKLINDRIENFCKLDQAKYKVFKNLGQYNYLSAMKHCNILIGNSSSGIIEAASFNKPVVNIGKRQSGRIRGPNIIDTETEDLDKSIKKALSVNFLMKHCKGVNIYGDGSASKNIVEVLSSYRLSTIKTFRDIKK